jgi:hypothetical protein
LRHPSSSHRIVLPGERRIGTQVPLAGSLPLRHGGPVAARFEGILLVSVSSVGTAVRWEQFEGPPHVSKFQQM